MNHIWRWFQGAWCHASVSLTVRFLKELLGFVFESWRLAIDCKHFAYKEHHAMVVIRSDVAHRPLTALLGARNNAMKKKTRSLRSKKYISTRLKRQWDYFQGWSACHASYCHHRPRQAGPPCQYCSALLDLIELWTILQADHQSLLARVMFEFQYRSLMFCSHLNLIWNV